MVCTDYTEHIDDGSVQITHLQVSIGTCKLFVLQIFWSKQHGHTNKMVVCSLKQGPIYYVYSVYLLLALVATKPNSFAMWIYDLAVLQ